MELLHTTNGLASSGRENDDKNEKKEEYARFIKLLDDIDGFADSADRIADKMVLADKNWFFGTMMKLMVK